MKNAIMILLAIGMAVSSFGQNDPVSMSRNKQFATVPDYNYDNGAGIVYPLVWNATTKAVQRISDGDGYNGSMHLVSTGGATHVTAGRIYLVATNADYYNFSVNYKGNGSTVFRAGVGYNNAGAIELFDSLGSRWRKIKDSGSRWVVNQNLKLVIQMKGVEAMNIDTTGIVTFDTSVKMPNISAGTVGADSLLGKSASTGAIVRLPPASSCISGTVTLVGGVGTISDSRITTLSRASAPAIKTPGGTLGVFYQVAFTSSTITVTARSSIGVTQTLDTSVLTLLWSPN